MALGQPSSPVEGSATSSVAGIGDLRVRGMVDLRVKSSDSELCVEAGTGLPRCYWELLGWTRPPIGYGLLPSATWASLAGPGRDHCSQGSLGVMRQTRADGEYSPLLAAW